VVAISRCAHSGRFAPLRTKRWAIGRPACAYRNFVLGAVVLRTCLARKLEKRQYSNCVRVPSVNQGQFNRPTRNFVRSRRERTGRRRRRYESCCHCGYPRRISDQVSSSRLQRRGHIVRAYTPLGSKITVEFALGNWARIMIGFMPLASQVVAGRFPLDGRRFWYNNDEYCWNLARDLSR